jgi:uncharacterized protein YyaL (SSP411 family)
VGLRWEDWGDAAFARARATGRPLLLSLTARWCGACHRMDEETWDDPGVAARVAEVAVPVRVDADARPDVYGRYHLGGLPTTALLTAEGDFLRGGTFLSPTQLFGLLDAAAADLRDGRRPAPRPRPAPLPPGVPPSAGAASPALSPGAFVDEVVARLVRRADREHGGFGGAPKHPEPDAVTLLLREARRRPDAALEAIAREALDAIAQHLVDPEDGAFFRYGAAADWAGPHTEKVTLDQAALIRLFLEAATTLGEPEYGAVARRALAHARERLVDTAGRAYASIAAQPDAEVDTRRFADAGAALAAAFLMAGAAPGAAAAGDAGPPSPPPLEFVAAAPDGAVPHRLDVSEGEAGPRGLLRDQALAITAALDAYRATGDPALRDWAARAAAWTIAHRWDAAAGAFLDAEPLAPARGRGQGQGAFTPVTGNGEMAQALLALADHARSEDAMPQGPMPGDALPQGPMPEGSIPKDAMVDAWRARAALVIASLSAQAARSPAGATLALAAQRLLA